MRLKKAVFFVAFLGIYGCSHQTARNIASAEVTKKPFLETGDFPYATSREFFIVRQLLQNVPGISIEQVDSWVVIDGRPDSSDFERIREVQAAYYGFVLNLAAPEKNICTIRACRYTAYPTGNMKELPLKEAWASLDSNGNYSSSSNMSSSSPIPDYYLPNDAAKIITKMEDKVAQAYSSVDGQVETLKRKTARKLSSLQSTYQKRGQSSEAALIYTKIKEVQGVLGIENWASPREYDVGRKTRYELIGNTYGAIWGSDTYTSDTDPATAAVHAGLLLPGERGIVEIEVVPGQSHYSGGDRHGVVAQPWGQWPVSYIIRKSSL